MSLFFSPLLMLLEMVDDLMPKKRMCVYDIAHHVFLAGEVESVGKRSTAPYIDIAR